MTFASFQGTVKFKRAFAKYQPNLCSRYYLEVVFYLSLFSNVILTFEPPFETWMHCKGFYLFLSGPNFRKVVFRLFLSFLYWFVLWQSVDSLGSCWNLPVQIHQHRPLNQMEKWLELHLNWYDCLSIILYSSYVPVNLIDSRMQSKMALLCSGSVCLTWRGMLPYCAFRNEFSACLSPLQLSWFVLHSQ